MDKYTVTFHPDNIPITVSEGTTVMTAAAEAGVELEGPCGGKGTCGKCRVKLLEENSERSILACQTKVNRDMQIGIPQAEISLYRKSELSRTEKLDTDPGLQKIVLEVEAPSLEKQVPDAERLLKAMEIAGFDNLIIKLGALRSLPMVLRAGRKVTVVLSSQEILAVEVGNSSKRLHGVAVDIGTTTVVVSLVDLLSGETLGTASATNSQNIFGADVIARIEHASQNERTLEQLRQRVVQVINRLIIKLSQSAGLLPGEIYQVAVAGNTTMNHLFLGLNPVNLAPSPYIPVVAYSVQLEARDAGLNISPHAPVYTLPNIAGYVGGDTVAVILSTRLYEEKGVVLALDIGTNGEIVLAAKGELWACSTAAGPAFEGAEIRYGMRAAAGAIEAIRVDEDVHLRVIDGASPKGICGSGLMDAVAELLKAGVINESGRMLTREDAGHLPPTLQARLGRDEQGCYFILAFPEGPEGEPVLLTQKDVRELQLAKAAMRVGAETLLKVAGLNYRDIEKVLLAGAFGSYIDKERALAIGLLPPVSLEKISAVGNAAGAGAKVALASAKARQTATEVGARVRHVELSGREDFQDQFIEELGFRVSSD
ncbi:MAG: ASKHA domain-containing protein [Desulfitobacteriaceae bacterium]